LEGLSHREIAELSGVSIGTTISAIPRSASTHGVAETAELLKQKGAGCAKTQYESQRFSIWIFQVSCAPRIRYLGSIVSSLPGDTDLSAVGEWLDFPGNS
jgi:hypothetical protein